MVAFSAWSNPQDPVRNDLVVNESGNELSVVNVVVETVCVTDGTEVVRVGVRTHSAMLLQHWGELDVVGESATARGGDRLKQGREIDLSGRL
jgi:hypothetical protein